MGFWSSILKAKTDYFQNWKFDGYRITTVERTDITTLLTNKEISLRLYDTDIKAWFTWKGTIDGWVQDSAGGGGVGSGDMLKSTYDTSNNGIVDNSEKLGGQLPAYYQAAESGKGLSQENYSTTEKSKLASITEIFTTALKSAYDGAVSSLAALLLTGSRLITTDEITKISNYRVRIPINPLTINPADSATYYFGSQPQTPTSGATTRKIFTDVVGTITKVKIYSWSVVAGTGQAWPLSIRKNNTTDTLIQSVSLATNERIWENTGLSISCNLTDYFEIKAVSPIWVTNPTTVQFWGYIEVTPT